MNLPEFSRYDISAKLKLFQLDSDDYIKQLFIKNNTIMNVAELKVDVNPDAMAPFADYGDYYYDDVALVEFYDKTIASYESKKIFCNDNPIIKVILDSYLNDISDFKIFYLFGNYEKPMRELKCAQQYELLETTNNFIEAITR